MQRGGRSQPAPREACWSTSKRYGRLGQRSAEGHGAGVPDARHGMPSGARDTAISAPRGPRISEPAPRLDDAM